MSLSFVVGRAVTSFLGDAPPGSVCTVETRKVVGRIISFPDLACELHQRLMQTRRLNLSLGK